MKMSFPVTVGFVIAYGLFNGLSIHRCFSQCAAVDFSAPSTACLGQSIEFTPSGSYSNYEWDFCSGDLALTPTASVLVNSFGGYGFKVELAEQNGSYYGFILTRATNKLYRLDFGSDIKNTSPVVVDLGGLGVNSSTWRVIEVTKEGAAYYGFISDNNLVYRISFGNSLTNTPSAAQVVYSGAPISTPIDMVIVEEGSSKYLFIANLGNEILVRLKFNGSYADTPILLTSITVTGAALLSGISFIRECNVWYCVATAIAVGRVYKLAFAGGIEDMNPIITNFSLGNAAGISVVQDNAQYYAFVQSQSATANVFRVRFGGSMANAPIGIDDLNNFGVSGTDIWAYSMFKVNSDWLTLSTDGSGPNVYSIKFPSNCFSNTYYSNQASPIILSSTPGSYNVALRVKDGQGNWLSNAHTIQINNLPAPDIEFNSQNVCVNNNVNFTSINSSGNLLSYNWNFGDTGVSSAMNPTHIYTAAATYSSSLLVIASNGCNNFVRKPLQVYNSPIANFELPTVSPVCTNQSYALPNTSAFDVASNPAWEWRLNGSLVSSQQNFNVVFNSATSQTIKLKALIPGCENEVTKTMFNFKYEAVSFILYNRFRLIFFLLQQ